MVFRLENMNKCVFSFKLNKRVSVRKALVLCKPQPTFCVRLWFFSKVKLVVNKFKNFLNIIDFYFIIWYN